MSGVRAFPRVYNALRAAKVPEPDALDAADAIATALRTRDSDSDRPSAADLADLRTEMRLVRLEVRVVGAMVLLLLVRLLFPTLFQ